ncbi:MAG: glycerol kinase [Candidatus Paceibacteria bacterium]|jgi:glycerol kinase
MTRTCIAAIDQGTTSTRCILFGPAGEVLGAAQKEHKQIFPKPGWVEHDACEIWRATQTVIREARLAAGEDLSIAAVGVTNQRETLVAWNRRTGVPYANAIVWQDVRTQAICDSLAADGGRHRFQAKTGLPLATYFSAPKLVWLFQNVPGLQAAAQTGEAICGTMESWLIWNLSGGVDAGAHVTDVTNASRTQWMNLADLQWDQELLDAFEVPRRMLARIVPSSDPEAWGHTSPSGPFGARIPICGAAGDQQAAMLGQCCFEVGEAKNTYGTGCFLLLNTGTSPVASNAGLLTTVAYKIGNSQAVYALEGSVAMGGALIQWLRDNLGLISSATQVEALARSVTDNGGVYVVPAFTGLFAPHWRPDARGIIAGLTRFANKGHIARACLEAVAFQTQDVLDAMAKDAGLPLGQLRVDGGMAANDLLLQFQADLHGNQVVRPTVLETTALGAAYAAGLAVDVFGSLEELRNNWLAEQTFDPKMAPAEREQRRAQWRKALARSLDWE